MAVVYRLEFGRKPTLICHLEVSASETQFSTRTPNVAQKSLSAAEICPGNEIQNGDRLRLVFPVLVFRTHRISAKSDNPRLC